MRATLSRWPALFIALPGILLGSTLVFTRFSLGQFPAETYVALRLTGGAFTFFIAYLALRRPFPRRRALWIRSGILGLIGSALTMTAYTQSLRYQSSGVTGMIAALSPVVTAVMAHFVLHDEPLTRQRVFGALVAFAGTGLLLMREETGLATLAHADWRGYAWALVGVVSNAAGLVYARRWLKNEDPFEVTSIRILVAGLVVSALVMLDGGFDISQVQLSGWLALFYAAVAGTFLAFFIYLAVVQRYGATTASQSEYIVPLVATGLGVFLLGEQVTPTMLVGMAIIFAGRWLFDRAGKIASSETGSPSLTPAAGHDTIASEEREMTEIQA